MPRNPQWASLAVLLAAALAFSPSSTLAQGNPPVETKASRDASLCEPFFPATVYLPNLEVGWPVLGDFNGDGIADLATVTWQFSWHGWIGSLTILLGNKNGTFRQGGTFPGAEGRLAVGDFNGDGKLDVASTNSVGAVDVFLGNGDGTFQPAEAYPVNQSTDFIAVGDFNGDGKLDIAVGGYGFLVVQVLLGNGDGTFQAPANYGVGLWASSIVVADFNGDGYLDLAVANAGYASDPGHTVSVLLGRGDGTFRPDVEYDVGYQPRAIVAADFNGDGKIDLATANWADGTASVLLGKGNGTFRPATTYTAGYPGGTYGIAAVQFDAGSKPGLVVATFAGTYVLANEGDGTLRTVQVYEPVPLGEFVVTDLDHDGKEDLVMAGGGPGSIGIDVLFGMGHGKFASSNANLALPNLSVVAEGDFNGDGRPDLAVVDAIKGQVAISLGQGKGHFSEPVGYYNVLGYPTAMAVGDLNGDGKLDLAVLTQGAEDKVQVFMGNGDGSFTARGAYSVAGSNGGGWIALADFNGDGVLDIVVTVGVTGSGVNVLLGNGDGSFKQAVVYSPGTNGLVIGDFNGDGKLDLAVGTLSLNIVSVYLGRGDGTFQKAINYRVASPADLAAADFNRDGKLDLAVLRHGMISRQPITVFDVEILLGNGDGGFRQGSHSPEWFDAWSVSAADVNGDGNADLVVVTFDQGVLYTLSGRGDGTFAEPVSSFIGYGSERPAIGDLNGDGVLDLAVPNGGGGVSVLLNHCPPR